jgi:SAM-dependent methyltransferase
MRESIKEFVEICGACLPIEEPIYEFGSMQVPGQEGFADLRSIFPNKRYVGADMRKGPGVDVVLNLHKIDLNSESAGTVLMLDTLEHVEYSREALKEVHRILRKDGILIMSSVMNFPIHDFPYDYWRFTPQAFKSLLTDFKYSFVESCGDPAFPHTVVGIGFKGGSSDDSLRDFAARIEAWKKKWNKGTASRKRRAMSLLIPPIGSTAIRKIRK